MKHEGFAADLLLQDAEPFMRARYEAEDIASRPLPPIEVSGCMCVGVGVCVRGCLDVIGLGVCVGVIRCVCGCDWVGAVVWCGAGSMNS